MAVAEARAVWQRAANRCFVQEDAKRAPKLACCPSTSSLAKHVEVGPASAIDGQDNLTPGFAPLNQNPSYSNLSPDSKWWLQLQPNYAYQRGLTNEQVNSNTSEGDMGKKDFGVVNQENVKVDESYEFVEMGSVDYEFSKESNEFSLDSGFSWMEGEKSEPWWKMTDKDELASFVAQRSHDFFENCDLPQPQNTSFKRDPYAHIGRFNGDEVFTSCKNWKPQSVGCPNPNVHTRCNSISGKNWASVEVHSQCGAGKLISEGTIHKGTSEMPISEMDQSKAQLLEALCHSQTRAREAEKAAKEAYAEKEHIVKLFFKQASHLFAYKQWFYLLQLENLYFQIKNNKSHPISSLFPLPFLWIPRKTRKIRKNWQKGKKRAKRSLPRYEHDISKYAVVLALGLSLGAGLLLGWTVGWMLPAL